MPCIHDQISDEAYVIDDRGNTAPAIVHLCEWPDQNPGRFVDAPRWLLRLVGAGLAITPERDCVGCPAFKAREG